MSKMKFGYIIAELIITMVFSSCSLTIPSENTIKSSNTSKPVSTIEEKIVKSQSSKLIDEKGCTLEERFKIPEGFERVAVDKGSFQEFLRTIKLKPHGSKVLYFNGKEKNKSDVYEAVIDIPIGNRDLHQCADAVMLLRAQYLYENKKYDDIHFNFVSGFKAEYPKWMQGYRITVNGNNVSWIKSNSPLNTQEEFRRFMDVVFTYASTLSLEKELKPVNKSEMKVGDVFIKGGSPGHAIIVMDMAENKENGEKIFMLAQSYMPAQETQILCNPNDKNLSPWYSLNYSGNLITPEWIFEEDKLRRFQD